MVGMVGGAEAGGDRRGDAVASHDSPGLLAVQL